MQYRNARVVGHLRCKVSLEKQSFLHICFCHRLVCGYLVRKVHVDATRESCWVRSDYICTKGSERSRQNSQELGDELRQSLNGAFNGQGSVGLFMIPWLQSFGIAREACVLAYVHIQRNASGSRDHKSAFVHLSRLYRFLEALFGLR